MNTRLGIWVGTLGLSISMAWAQAPLPSSVAFRLKEAGRIVERAEQALAGGAGSGPYPTPLCGSAEPCGRDWCQPARQPGEAQTRKCRRQFFCKIAGRRVALGRRVERQNHLPNPRRLRPRWSPRLPSRRSPAR